MTAPSLSPSSTVDGTLPAPRPRGYVKETLGTDASIFVVKVGTTSLMRPEHQTVNLSSLAKLCEAVRDLRSQGHHVIIVTSGAVGVGAQHLSLPGPEPLRKRALAAVGQVQLIKYYEDFLGALGLKCAQLLLTLDNLANRSQYLNARTTFTELLAYGVVPIVNENDTVAVQELRFGDNDTLSAQVAALVQADWLFLLTDVDCLYTANPKDDPNATPIYEVEDISRLTADTSTRGTQWGTGGMATKLTAGRIATAAGCTMVICNSTAPENIVRIAQLWLDAGAVRAVRDKHRPLVAAGITRVEGEFGLQVVVHRGNLVLLSASEELPPPPPLQQQATADIDDLLAAACAVDGAGEGDDASDHPLPAPPVSPLAAGTPAAGAAALEARARAASAGGGETVLLPPLPLPVQPLAARHQAALAADNQQQGKLAPCGVVAMPLLPDVEEGGGGLLERAATTEGGVAVPVAELAKKLGDAVSTAVAAGGAAGGSPPAAEEKELGVAFRACVPSPLPPVPLQTLPAA
eukprot:XP_001691563.1 glutamate 5-kinase [Chlamydomonas reinhardtii]